ncbi:hypothetical protein THAOC_22747, partial [Thalassiosira oceanica]
MADDQSNKRPKNGPGASCGDARDARIDVLEYEILSLRQQLRRSDAEVARLRQQLQWRQGSHETLPVITPPSTVDISRLDTGLVAQVVSFVGTSRELLNLALTCKSFGWQQPASGLDLSLVDEVARGAVCSWRNDIDGVRITLPSHIKCTTTWLSVLHEHEHPLKFDTLLGGGIDYT